MKSVNTNFLGSLLIIISHGAHKYAISANQLQIRFTSQQKLKTFSPSMVEKHFFQAHVQFCIDYASTLWDSASDFLLKPLKSLHRRAIKICFLKHTSLANEHCKSTTFLPLKARLMCNKARFMHEILSGQHPLNFQKRCLSTIILETAHGSLMFPCLDQIYLNLA